jgi:cytochrome P450
LFPDPESFVLDRFLGAPVEGGTVTAPDGTKVPNGFMPFGSGISTCPGRHFARAEIKLFLIELLTRFDLAGAEGGGKQGTTRASPLSHPGYLLSRAGLGIFPPAKDVQVAYTQKQQ